MAAAALLTTTAAYAQKINGAGATFPAPLYAKWAQAAKTATGIELNYQALGSGAGQTQIINRTVDFGASDAPMPADKLTANRLRQVPSVMGAVVVIVNIPGVEVNQMRLSGTVLAAIYAGTIKTWNHPEIQALNPNATLSNLPISPVYRADGSGTTFVWTSYLGTVSPGWLQTVGIGTSVKWPTGNGAKGNDGVAATVKQVRGAIGYVESIYASANKLTTTQLENADKKFVTPTGASFQSAAANADWANAQNFQVDLINQPGAASWPIVSATYLLLPTDAKDPAQAKLVRDWITWVYTHGDGLATAMDYVPLPKAVQAQVLDQIKG
jgi:phosphate transport system substrate-binding protein